MGLAVSNNGHIAVGRVGHVDFYGDGNTYLRFGCPYGCGYVSAVTFAPNGQHLLYQGAPRLADSDGGQVSIADTLTGIVIEHLATRSPAPRIAFAPDGTTLAVGVYQPTPGGAEQFGLRLFRSADWAFDREISGGAPVAGTIGYDKDAGWLNAYWNHRELELVAMDGSRKIWTVDPFPAPMHWSSKRTVRSNIREINFAANGPYLAEHEFLEADDGETADALVIRRLADGGVYAVYDMPGLAGFALSSDGRVLAYYVTSPQSYLALAPVSE